MALWIICVASSNNSIRWNWWQPRSILSSSGIFSFWLTHHKQHRWPGSREETRLTSASADPRSPRAPADRNDLFPTCIARLYRTITSNFHWEWQLLLLFIHKGHPISCDVYFCFLLEVPVTNWAAQQLQYQLNGRWNMSKMLYKTLGLSWHLRVNICFVLHLKANDMPSHVQLIIC